MFEYRGKVALITGASMGIGAAFARELAARGMNLVLVARSVDRLQALADELTPRHGIRVEVVPADLSQPDAGRAIAETCSRLGLEVHLLVNNAGFGTSGPFHTISPERERDEVMVNVLAVVDLTHRFLPGMRARKAGGIINVASTAAFQPIPYLAVYAASKAFVLSFSEALWAECQEEAVRVLALCPGPGGHAVFRAHAAPGRGHPLEGQRRARGRDGPACPRARPQPFDSNLSRLCEGPGGPLSAARAHPTLPGQIAAA